MVSFINFTLFVATASALALPQTSSNTCAITQTTVCCTTISNILNLGQLGALGLLSQVGSLVPIASGCLPIPLSE
jgi:hypothetical protein